MPDIDPSLFDADPLAPDAKARMQALIQLLGQQQQGNVMGAMGGTLRTGMQHLGQGMEQQAQQQMGMVQGAPAARLQLAMQKLKQQQAQQEMTQEGPQAALGGMSPKVATAKAHLLTAQSGQQNWDHVVNPDSGEAWIINKRTGEARPLSGAGGAGGGGKLAQKWVKDLEDDLDPNKFRSGVLKGNQERVNAAQRLLTLAVDPLNGQPANLTPQQMSELSSSLATLIGGGGSSEASRHEMTPYTKGRSMAQLLQWFSDKPQGADQQAFVKQMIDTAKREQGVAQGAIRQAQVQRLPGHALLFQKYGDLAKPVLEGYGIDPAEVDFKTGKHTPKPKTPEAPKGAATTKTVGGKTYEKRADGWYEVGNAEGH